MKAILNNLNQHQLLAFEKKITAHKRLGTNTFLISQNKTAKLWLKIVSLSMLANQSEVMGGG